MFNKIGAITSLLFLSIFASSSWGLDRNKILVIANGDISGSVQIANYYCQKRSVPRGNILALRLGTSMAEQVSRDFYEKNIAGPIRRRLGQMGDGQIRCLLTVYGVPLKIAAAVPDENADKLLAKLRPLAAKKLRRFREKVWVVENTGETVATATVMDSTEKFEAIAGRLGSVMQTARAKIDRVQDVSKKESMSKSYVKLLAEISGKLRAVRIAEKDSGLDYSMSMLGTKILKRHLSVVEIAGKRQWSVKEKFKYDYYNAAESALGLIGVLKYVYDDIGQVEGKETFASVDSELSCVLKGKYNLFKWQRNELKGKPLWEKSETMMVSRIDGPGMKICYGIIDKSIRAQAVGVSGKAYIDLRGAGGKEPFSPGSYGYYDNSLNKLGAMIERRTNLPVVIEKTSKLFSAGQCPQTALYCGWYSLKKYVDAFDFVDGAVGFHIASFEAMNLRNAKSSNWCPAMLVDGITATLGAVNEPYLHSFPEPEMFFAELLNGRSLVEAFYLTKPFNSWQLVLIGDPLYKLNLR